MEKIKNFYNSKTNQCNILIIVIVTIIGFLIFKDNFNGLLTDKGREMLFPSVIADGKILYKDILCIYFPFAFQINALFFKIFSPHLNVLLALGLINTICIGSLLYYISKEFLNKNFSLLFAVTYIFASAFNGTLFNSVLPYSTSFTYGITAFMLSTLLMIKYIKSDRCRYIYLAYLFGGFAIACKSEFSLMFLLLLFTSVILKPLSLKQNFIGILLYSVFPIVSFGFLFIQGLTLNEFIAAFDFMHKFFTTDSMIYHIKRTGGLPFILNFDMYIPSLLRLLLFFCASFLMFKISKINIFVKIATIAACVYIANLTYIGTHSLLLPIVMTVFVIFKFKELYNNKTLLILILASLCLNIRMFWALNLNVYGMLTAYLLILALVIVLLTYMKDFKYLTKGDLNQFIVYLMLIYLTFYIAFDYVQTTKNTTPLKTTHGTIYLPKKKAEALEFALKYINQYTLPEQKIIVLPEGMAINFLADRPLDLSLPMIDRLYHDAFDEKEIIDKLKKADYEIIFIVKGYGLTNFGKPYLYSDDNAIMQYIKQNYFADWHTEYHDGKNSNEMTCYVKPY